jgi:hypothetical protein
VSLPCSQDHNTASLHYCLPTGGTTSDLGHAVLQCRWAITSECIGMPLRFGAASLLQCRWAITSECIGMSLRFGAASLFKVRLRSSSLGLRAYVIFLFYRVRLRSSSLGLRAYVIFLFYRVRLRSSSLGLRAYVIFLFYRVRCRWAITSEYSNISEVWRSEPSAHYFLESGYAQAR